MSFWRRLTGRAEPPPQRVEPPSPRLVPPSEAFTPTQPKTGRRRLIGRQAELARILQLLQQDKSHVVLYSERGRGKTSLANLAIEALRREGVIVARHTCDASAHFDSIMRGLMRDLPHALMAASAGGAGEGCEAALPPGALQPRDIVAVPRRLACRSLVCVVDEFDRVDDLPTRTRLADTIKQLSDRDAPLLFLIVGVSDNLDQILGQHPSIQRSVAGVHLPLFTDREVAQIIAKGGKEAGFTFPPAAIARITVLSRGMPYMAQLLGLRLAQAAQERGGATVTDADFDAAVARMVADAPPRVTALHAALTANGADADMVLALRRVATAPQDPWGRLTVAVPLGGSGHSVMVGGRAIPMRCWEELCTAQVLHPGAPGSGLFSFAERGLMHHVLLLAARDMALEDAQAPGALPAPAGEVHELHTALLRG